MINTSAIFTEFLSSCDFSLITNGLNGVGLSYERHLQLRQVVGGINY
jgi:hypothetical protein